MASPPFVVRSLSADYTPSLDDPKMCQASRGSITNEYVVNTALSHCDTSVTAPLSPRQHLCSTLSATSTGQPPPSPPPLLAPVAGVKAKLVKPRVISKHMMMHSVLPRQSSPPPSLPPGAAQCTLLNPPSGAVVLHQPHASAFAAMQQQQQQHSQEARRRSSGYQSTVSSLRSRSSSPLPPLPSPTSPSPRRISVPVEPGEELSICPRCGRCRCQQCREPQPLPRKRVYGRCVVSDKCCVDVLSCMIVPKYLFDHACCCVEEGRPGGRQVPGITVSSHGGPKSSVSGGYGGLEFSSDSGVWWGGPSSSISYGGVSFPCDEDPASTSAADNGDPCSAVSPRPSTATNDWLQQAAAVSTPPPRLSDDPLACSSRPLCCPRWTALACLSLCLPCLCLYPAIRAGAKVAQWCYNKRVGMRGCHCKPPQGVICSEPPSSVGFVKEREEPVPGQGRCLFIVMEDT